MNPPSPLLLAAAALAVGTCVALSTGPSTRRGWISHALGSSAALVGASPANADVDLREFSALAPLGAPTSTGSKTTGLSLGELAKRLEHDLAEGATGKGGYFISGDISTEIFRDDCAFVDPTNSVSSLSRYQNALKILFDPEQSFVQLVEPLGVGEEQREIVARIRSGGALQLPWRPRIPPYESTIKYSVDDDGLIASQTQEWSITSSEALRETFVPLWNAPYSTLPRPSNEPKAVTELFELINGHRPDAYSQEYRFRIATLIDTIADGHYDWKREDLPGKWALVYLQPGPDGGGIDRRIPFPELPFNDNYQIFGPNSVTNVGELLGSRLEVRVGGTLAEEDRDSLATPKRFRASIERGGLCAGRESDACTPLPISGVGLFDGVYLGERLRIGQNLNGGGARVVQVKIA